MAISTDMLQGKVRSGILWSALQSWGTRFSSLLVFMLIARVLPPEEIGLFAAATVVIAFFGMLAEQGLSEAVVQRPDISGGQVAAVFCVNMFMSITLFGMVWFLADQIANLLKTPGIAPLLQVSAAVMPISAAASGQVAMRKRTFGYRWIATSTLISTLFGIGAVVVMIHLGAGVWALVAQLLASALVMTTLMWVRPAWPLRTRPSFRGFGGLMSYGSTRLGTYLLDFANTRYVEIFLAATLGPVVLAVYAVGLKLYQALMQMMSATILDVAHSGFSRLAHDRAGLVAAYYRSITLTATVAVPVFCLVAAVAPSLVVVLFGSQWLQSAEVMAWTAMLGAVQVMQFYNGTVYNAIGRPGIGLQFMILKVIITIGALHFAQDSGMTGLLHAYVFSQLTTTPLSFYLVRRMIGVSLTEVFRCVWPMLLGCSLLFVSARWVEMSVSATSGVPFLSLVSAVSVGVLCYFGTLRLFAPGTIGRTLSLLRRAKG